MELYVFNLYDEPRHCETFFELVGFRELPLSDVGRWACRHIQNAKKYGIPVVIAINKFATDTDAELQAVKSAAKEAGSSPSCNNLSLIDPYATKSLLVHLASGKA